MDRAKIQSKIQEARELVGDTPEDPLTQIAFREVLRILLQEHPVLLEEKSGLKTEAVLLPKQLSEFLAQKNIKKHVGIVVAILYYHNHSGQESTTILELQEAYSSVRVKAPQNFSDVLAQCIRKGYVVGTLSKEDGKKAWQITSTGERYVEGELGR